MAIRPDFVFAGGGPVSLLTAIETKARLAANQETAGKEIVVLERYQEYKRDSIRLNLDQSSFDGVFDEGLKKITKTWKGRAVPIKEMETTLVKRANELGIHIFKGVAAEPKKLAEQFPDAKVLIGADGAKSLVRKEIFGDKFQFNSNLQYIARVQYVVKAERGPNKKILRAAEAYKMQKFAGHIVNQTIKPLENGDSLVTLEIFLDEKTYKQISNATFGNPYYLETDLKKLPEALKEVLIKWWGARAHLHHEVIQKEGKEKNKITVIALNSYAVKDAFIQDEKGRNWAVVGDASAAFPFFRAVNNGFITGIRLAKCLAKGIASEDPKVMKESLRSYAKYAKRRAYIERIKAFVKNIFINLSKVWIKVSHFVPWQVVKLSTAVQKKVRENGEVVWNRLCQTA